MNDSYDFYLYIIIAMLPLTAVMLVTQVNPYHALVIRGVLGAVAVIVDAILGAADVALTEALMGTMLSVTLYVVAVRSSLVLRLGVIEHQEIAENQDSNFQEILDDFRRIFKEHYMRVELVPYATYQCLEKALAEKEVHATCARVEESDYSDHLYQTAIRVQRVYNIIEDEISSQKTTLSYVKI
jgi:putative multicomponent Na+:H+ antiporter subunit B